VIPSNIEVNLDKQAIQRYIEKHLDNTIQSELWFVDVERLVQLTTMSKRFIENEILCDPRMRIIERRRNRKRWWPAKAALETIEEITSEW